MDVNGESQISHHCSEAIDKQAGGGRWEGGGGRWEWSKWEWIRVGDIIMNSHLALYRYRWLYIKICIDMHIYIGNIYEHIYFLGLSVKNA